MKELLGQKFSTLDNQGWIKIIDIMGDDERVVEAARNTVDKTQKVHDNKGLLRYLMRHKHTTPFEFCEITFQIYAPMDLWRDWIRHRTASVNEFSTRYAEAIDHIHHTLPGKWRFQDPNNRQGSSGEYFSDEDGINFSDLEFEVFDTATYVYNELIDRGVAREQARKVLPLSNFTRAYWKIDLHNLLHFVALRSDSHASLEIREYADIIGEQIIAKWCPIIWEAFNDYHELREAMLLTRLEKELIRCFFTEGDHRKLMKEFGWLECREDGSLKRNREREEALEKFTYLGVDVFIEGGSE